jgi:hypothetical protein
VTTVTLCFSKQTVMYTKVAALTRRTRVVLPGLTVTFGRCWLLHLEAPMLTSHAAGSAVGPSCPATQGLGDSRSLAAAWTGLSEGL